MQKTAYEMRISDWSSDVCSSDLHAPIDQDRAIAHAADRAAPGIGDRPDRGDVRQILIVIGVYRHAVGIGAPGTIDRSAVGHAAAADQAHAVVAFAGDRAADRKSTRLNSSH